MKDIIEFFRNATLIRKIYTSTYFLFVIPFLSFYISQKTFEILKNIFGFTDEKYFILLLLLICVSLYVLWWRLQQPPKIKFGKLGIVIAINTESDEEKKRLKNDFVVEIKTQISAENSQLFQVLVLPDFFTEKINDANSACKYLAATKAHFFISGTWKTRLDGSKEIYILNLEANVVHAPIDIFSSNVFSKEMAVVFPRDVRIPKELEVTEIPLTGDLVSFAAKHCIGIASFISGNVGLAYNLHLSLWNRIKESTLSKSTYSYCVSVMKQKLPRYLYQEAIFICNYYYENKPPDYLEKIKEHLDVIFSFFPKDYSALVRQGIYFFEKGEVEDALKTTKKAVGISGNRDITARYNLAFLYAYIGKLEEAHKEYKHAFSGTVFDPKFLLSIEEFIENLLKKNPEKFQFYYCLGMINFFGKEDMKLAKENFEKFIKTAKSLKKYLVSIKYAQKYLDEAESKVSNLEQ